MMASDAWWWLLLYIYIYIYLSPPAFYACRNINIFGSATVFLGNSNGFFWDCTIKPLKKLSMTTTRAWCLLIPLGEHSHGATPTRFINHSPTVHQEYVWHIFATLFLVSISDSTEPPKRYAKVKSHWNMSAVPISSPYTFLSSEQMQRDSRNATRYDLSGRSRWKRMKMWGFCHAGMSAHAISWLSEVARSSGW